MRLTSLLLATCATMLCGGAAYADDATADPQDKGVVHALTPDEIAAIKAKAAARNLEAATQDATTISTDAPPARKVHGEMGIGFGTGGYRSVYGTIVYPLGDEGYLALSMADTQMQAGPRFKRR